MVDDTLASSSLAGTDTDDDIAAADDDTGLAGDTAAGAGLGDDSDDGGADTRPGPGDDGWLLDMSRGLGELRTLGRGGAVLTTDPGGAGSTGL